VTIAFAAGHVGATLIVAAGLWIGIKLGATGPARLRPGRVIGYVVAVAALSHTFTDFGHLTAVAIGLACYPLVPKLSRAAGLSLPPAPRRGNHVGRRS
jgi:rhomboid family protein